MSRPCLKKTIAIDSGGFRKSPPEVFFLVQGVLNVCSKFTGEHHAKV